MEIGQEIPTDLKLLSVKVSDYSHNQPTKGGPNQSSGPYSKYYNAKQYQFKKGAERVAIYEVSDLHGAPADNIMYNIERQANNTTADEVIVLLNGDYPKDEFNDNELNNLKAILNQKTIKTKKE